MLKELEFLCLASSLKHRERCIAGISLKGRWIRLVSKREDGALNGNEYRLENGTDPEHFDVICVKVEKSQPEPHQPENYVIADSPWKLRSRLAPSNHKALIEDHIYEGSPFLGFPGKGIAFQGLQSSTSPMEYEEE
ncbi:MAG TPA: hypothetical protein VK914_04745 [bacterium]|jgi:hypothetical protein|nr:hypothetical protein [bacterium]